MVIGLQVSTEAIIITGAVGSNQEKITNSINLALISTDAWESRYAITCTTTTKSY